MAEKLASRTSLRNASGHLLELSATVIWGHLMQKSFGRHFWIDAEQTQEHLAWSFDGKLSSAAQDGTTKMTSTIAFCYRTTVSVWDNMFRLLLFISFRFLLFRPCCRTCTRYRPRARFSSIEIKNDLNGLTLKKGCRLLFPFTIHWFRNTESHASQFGLI